MISEFPFHQERLQYINDKPARSYVLFSIAASLLEIIYQKLDCGLDF